MSRERIIKALDLIRYKAEEAIGEAKLLVGAEAGFAGQWAALDKLHDQLRQIWRSIELRRAQLDGSREPTPGELEHDREQRERLDQVILRMTEQRRAGP